jgi:ribosomal-protein-alanine N-acetyltransferase
VAEVTVSLRTPIASDYCAIASWIADAEECARWAGPLMPFPFSGDELLVLFERIPPLVPGEVRTSFVLLEEGLPGLGPQTIAFAQIVREDAANFRLARILVAPHKRGGGVGTSLCRLLIAKVAATPGARMLKLFVYRENTAAMRLYAGIGFEIIPPHPWPDVIAMSRAV